MSKSDKDTDVLSKGEFADAELKKVFLKRADIKSLPQDKQEEEWKKQLEGINAFRSLLSGPGVTRIG